MDPIEFNDMYSLELDEEDNLVIVFDGEQQVTIASPENWEEEIDQLINALQKARRQCPA